MLELSINIGIIKANVQINILRMEETMRNSRTSIQKRQAVLLKELQALGSCDVNQLAKQLNVSPITIRRDLAELQERGYIERFFGGARVKVDTTEDEEIYMESTTQFLPEKQAIAKKAAELIEDGDIIFINSSSTALFIYPYIKNKSVCIITNNAKSLSMQRSPEVELILTGGEVNGNKQALIGQVALDTINHITASKCIFGVSGISSRGGITSRVIQETSINHAMLSRCTGAKIIVADHTKIGMEHNFFSGEASEVTHLITGSRAPAAELEKLRRLNIEIILAESESIQ